MSKPKVEPLRLGKPKKEKPLEKSSNSISVNPLWELMELEAREKFFVNNKEYPAFLYFPKYHYLSAEKSYHSLYLHTVGLINIFSSRQKAFERLKQIVENANFPLKLYQMSKYGRNRGKRILFAENKIQQVPLEPERVVEGAVVKVFNITEWEKELKKNAY